MCPDSNLAVINPTRCFPKHLNRADVALSLIQSSRRLECESLTTFLQLRRDSCGKMDVVYIPPPVDSRHKKKRQDSKQTSPSSASNSDVGSIAPSSLSHGSRNASRRNDGTKAPYTYEQTQAGARGTNTNTRVPSPPGMPPLFIEPNCGICNAPAAHVCDCEANALTTAMQQGESRMMAPIYGDIRLVSIFPISREHF